MVNPFQDLDLHAVSTPHLASDLKVPLELLRQDQIEEIHQEVFSFTSFINCNINQSLDYESSELYLHFY